ncbi:hypothetical protein QFZ37_002752 [Chryseobacterium ginsenosidimutans]|uniref:glutathione synthase n=1 Tax=Chryseobacterium ginsenosidimutans TaxID=687846 RepID=UPI0027834952|nr:glutathione synthase [Chryseobacterium ginsenosidimutans]MDQ0594383.1 hypothetical protein [Chryseobacterium ginsenosidimutans]
MEYQIFKKEDFVRTDDERCRLEFKKSDIGIGSDLLVEELLADGQYSVVQAEITRYKDQVFIYWSTPFDGRLVFNIKY